MRRHQLNLYLLIFLIILLTVSFPSGQSQSLPDASAHPAFKRIDLDHGPKYVPGEVLVRFKPGTSQRAMMLSHAREGGTIKREFTSVEGLHSVKLSSKTSLKAALRGYKQDPSVLYAEPNYVVQAQALPNDPLFPQQWGLSNSGQGSGLSGADIHAQQAWDITTGSSDVVVAIIDTGIDYTHPDLAANIWSAPAPFSWANNGATVNCPAGTHGINLSPVGNNCDPMDIDGHGTHVAGIIGAAGNNGLGVSGVNWNIKLLACNFTGALDTVEGAVTCLDFVKTLKDAGVNIVATNNSYAGNFLSQALIDALAAQQQDGILFIAAAGNDFQDNDLFPTYPANLYFPNLLSVAATNSSDGMPTFSNYGAHTVHLGAPGQDILSTLPGGVYGLDTGTSMSAPFVTGVAALLKAAHPSWDWRTIRNQILAGGDTIPAMANTVTGKRLNAYGALTCSNSTVGSRLQPTMVNTAGAVGAPTTLAYLNINCGQPNGPVNVEISPGGGTLTLQDNGTGGDLAAGDGIYTGQWTPPALGSYTLSFPGGDNINLQVLANYSPYQLPPSQYSYRNITGTNLNLGDDSVAAVNSPFPIQFGGGSFSKLYVSSNGTISFTDVFGAFDDVFLPPNAAYQSYSTLTTLVAPFWQDLYPVAGTDNNVFWEVTGAAPNRELVVEWRNVESFGCRGDTSATVKFQVVLSEGSSDVLFNYANTEFGGNCLDEDHGARAEVGIQVAPTTATTWGFEEAVVGNESGILWKTITGTQPSNPVPVITSVSPSTVQAGGPDTLVTITGSNFLPQSLAYNAPYPRPTTYVSSTDLQVLILAADIQYNGGVGIEVYNPVPGGGYSNMMNITVSGESPPVITAINPLSAVAGGFGFRMEVDGTGFASSLNSTVQWNGASLSTYPYGTNKLVAEVTNNLIANPGTAQITINNLNLGGVSSAVPFTITAPTAQTAAPAGSTALTPEPITNPRVFEIPGTIKSPKFLPRFMGWNRARTEGPEYVQHFLRTHAGLATGSASPKSGSAASGLPRQLLAQTLSPSLLPGFQFRPSLPADLLPDSVATGDFNHDGHIDWVVANGGANSLWIYLGKGDGTAQLPVIIPLTGQSPSAVAAADLRGIGVLDLIVAEADSGTIGVLLGNGDGTFGVERTYFVPAAPLCLLVDDFNGDGHKDILVGVQGSNTVGELALFPGDGAGHFGAPIYGADEHTEWNGFGDFAALSLVEADLNGDGFPDLVVLDCTDGGDIYDASAFLNQKDGTFKATQVVDWAMPTLDNILTNVTVGDVNGDGCPDLVDTNGLGAAIVFLGNCDGTFQNQAPVRQFGLGDIAGGLTLVDVNGDGKLDLVTSSVVEFNTEQSGVQPGNLVSVLWGDGKGNFSPARVFRGGPSMYSLALADLNGDSKLDIITANQDTDSVSVFLNDGSGGFGAPMGGFLGYPPPATNTGVIDAPIGGVQGGIYGEPYYGLKVADVNEDGKPDLVGLESGRMYPEPLNLVVLLNQGSYVFSGPVFSPVMDGSNQNPNFVGDWAMGDFRTTGRPDFVAVGSPYSSGSSFIAFAKNNGDGTFTPLPLATPSGAQGLIGIGDFNDDGKLDLVVVGVTSSSSGANYTLSVFLGNGDGTFRPGYSATASSGGLSPYKVWIGDFNGDGKPDVLVEMQTNGYGAANVYEFLGNGDGTFAPGKIVLQNFGPMNVADLNHDGIGDVVEMLGANSSFTQPVPVQYAVYLGQHDGSFLLQNTYDLNAGTLAIEYPYDPGVMLGDFNGDGNIDIGAFQAVGGTSVLQILAGNGDGTFTPTYSIFKFNQFVVPQYAVDLNGDGKADLLELDGYGSAYQIVPAATGPALQLNLVSVPVVGSTGSARTTLAVPATADTTIALASTDPAISLPASVTVPAGSVSQDFQFQLGSGFNPNHVFSIQASLSGQTSAAYGWEAGSSQTGFSFRFFDPIEYYQMVLAGQATSAYLLLLSSTGGYSTTVQLSCTGLPSWATCQFDQPNEQLLPGSYVTPNMVVATTPAAVVGMYAFTVVATDGTIQQQTTAILTVGDFGISITPATQSVPATGAATYNLTVASVNSYAGVIDLGVSGLPAGASVQTPLGYIAAGSSASPMTIQLTNVAAGSYPITVTGISYPYTLSGANPGITRSAVATLVVEATPGFTSSITPPAATVVAGQSGNFSLTLNSQNGATGTVNFQCSTLPTGATCAFNPTSPTLPGNGSVTDALTVQVNSSVTAGSYPFTITATSGSLTSSATATLVVQAAPSFSGSISPTSATLSVGQSASFAIALNSQNGATGTVNLQCLNVPSGTTCTFNPLAPTLPANGSASDTLTVQVNSRPSASPPKTPAPWLYPKGPVGTLWLFVITLAAVSALTMKMWARRRRRAASAAVLIAIGLLFLATASCGGGGGGGSGPSPSPPSSVVFTITVQANGAEVSTTQTIGTLTITVN